MNLKRIYILLPIIALGGCWQHSNSTLQGYIEGDLTYISSQVSGRLMQLPWQKGNTIKQNAKLFTLEPLPESDQVAQAKAAVAEAGANLANLQKGQRPSELAAIQAQQRQLMPQIALAKKTVVRYRKLYQNKYIQKESLDQAVSNLKDLQAKLQEVNENLTTAKLGARNDEIIAAKAKLQQAVAALKQAQWTLKQKVIPSPIGGTLFDSYYRVGEVVPADHPVVSIQSPDNIYLLFYAPEQMLSTLKLGQKVSFTCDSCTKNLTANIRYISNEAEYTPPVIYSEASREKLIYRVEANLTPDELKTLHPGEPVSVRLGSRI